MRALDDVHEQVIVPGRGARGPGAEAPHHDRARQEHAQQRGQAGRGGQ